MYLNRWARLFLIGHHDKLIAVNPWCGRHASVTSLFKNTPSFAFQIVHLTVVQRPRKDTNDQKHKQDRHRDQEIENFHAINSET
jgi:hypothetical protein